MLLSRSILSVAAALLLGLAGSAVSAEPAQAQSAVAPRAPCGSVSAPKGATDTERRVWLSLCRGGYADLSALDNAGCQATDLEPWPIGRAISAAFLQQILFDPPWRDARGGAATHLRCAAIIGDLDLSHRRLQGSLLLEESRVDGDLSLLGATIEGVLSVRGSRLEGALDAEGLRAESDLFLRGGVFAGPVSLRGVRMVGALEAQGARFDAGLSLDQARVQGPARLTGAEIRSGPADFTKLAADALDLRRARLLGAEGASLRGARLDVLDASIDAWPTSRDFRDLRAARGAYLEAESTALIAWIESGFPGGAQDFALERAAYVALSDALVTAGRSGEARDVEIAERRRFLDQGGAEGLSAAAWRLWEWTSGFGRLPERVVIWAAALALLGAGLGAASPVLRREGVGGLLRLSVSNAFFVPGAHADRAALYRVGSGFAAAFTLQRICGAALLAALVFALAQRAAA